MDSSVFTFDATNRILSVLTSDVAKINLYNIKVTGYLIDPNVKSSITFKVDVRDHCENLVITKAADATINYLIKAAATTYTTLAFTLSMGTCGSVSYTCTKADGTPFDSSIFTFNGAVPNL